MVYADRSDVCRYVYDSARDIMILREKNIPIETIYGLNRDISEKISKMQNSEFNIITIDLLNDITMSAYDIPISDNEEIVDEFAKRWYDKCME